ncbi:MAG TPA: lytic transglycosylase domain-containing protein [Gemmatimonadaceae bacterium]|nr:lytic transglycosylase domain-containing protein [Gemmatimonadaceae bacterium]
MKKLRSTYVHRGDAIRRRNRIKKAFAVIGVVGAALFVIANRQPSTPTAEAAVDAGATSSFSFGLLGENRRLRMELENAVGEASLLKAQMDRANRIITYSSRYGIPANLTATIFDVALAERVDPELGFRLVELESGFNPRATSRVGAMGLVQLMPSTAIQFDRTATGEKLYDPETNLHIGFRYLRRLIDAYGGNVRLALLAYNLGEDAVDQARREKRNPFEGYNRILLKSYTGSGVTD